MRNLQTNFVWNQAADAILREHWSTALTVSQIGVEMGLTKNSIMGRVKRLGLPSRRAHEKRFNGLVAVQNLGARTKECCYPIGEPKEPDFRFCEAPVVRKGMCEEHATLCWTAPKKRPGTASPQSGQTMVWSNFQQRLIPKRMAGAK